MKQETSVVTARIDPKLIDRLDVLKIITRKSRNTMIREAIDQYLAAHSSEHARETINYIEALR